ALWDPVGANFRTRSQFLTVWPGVRHVALHRGPSGAVDGFLLATGPIHWPIDCVVVRPEARGRGIAGGLVRFTLNEAHARKAPYVMLASREGLRPTYEGCG